MDFVVVSIIVFIISILSSTEFRDPESYSIIKLMTYLGVCYKQSSVEVCNCEDPCILLQIIIKISNAFVSKESLFNFISTLLPFKG